MSAMLVISTADAAVVDDAAVGTTTTNAAVATESDAASFREVEAELTRESLAKIYVVWIEPV